MGNYKLILLYFVLVSVSNISNTHAQKWLCHETASVRYDSRILTCGVGEAKTESEARNKAFESATKEFNQLCEQDITCKGFKTRVEPQRNSCSFLNGTYKCYRGLEYQITTVKKDSVDLKKVEDELEKKKKEYALAKEKYEKKKELEELEKKIEKKDFSDEPSEWNNFIHLGAQLSLSAGSTSNSSVSGFTFSGLVRYIPKKRWGLQYKHYSLNLNGDELEDNDYYDSTTPVSYSASGSIDTVSLVYYFRNLQVKGSSTAFIAFGKGNFTNKYSFSYRQDFNFETIKESGTASSESTYFSIGYTGTESFNKSGDTGYEFGIDYYNLDQSDVHHLDSILDFYIALVWGY